MCELSKTEGKLGSKPGSVIRTRGFPGTNYRTERLEGWPQSDGNLERPHTQVQLVRQLEIKNIGERGEWRETFSKKSRHEW